MPTPDETGARALHWLAIAAVALAMASTLYSAWSQDWTIDEPLHLQWSERFWDTGVGERLSQSRYMSKTPATVPHVLALRTARRAGVTDPRWLRFAARLPSVACVAAILAATFLLARTLFGTTAARVALTAVALDPSIAAHGSLVTVDAAYAAATLLVLGAALRFARRPSLARGALLGLAFGLAFAVKFSAMVLLPGLVFLPRPPQGWLRRRGLLLACALVSTAVLCLTLCAAYLFHELWVPLGRLTWLSGPMSGLAAALPGLRLPLPAAFLSGLDVSFANERRDWNVVILGRRYPQGVWFYFGLLWLLKTPLLLLVAQGVGLLEAARRRLLADPPRRFIAANLLLHAAYFSFVFHTQLGYRFVLMLVPVAWALASVGLVAIPLTTWRRRAAVAAIGLAVAENALFFGNPLAFTNAAVWPKRDVFRLIADSNVDWGQNREKIVGWLQEADIPEDRLDPLHVLQGTNVLDLNALAGTFDFEQHRWLREHASPRDHFGHTHLRFEVDGALYARFLDENRRLASHQAARALCGPELPYAELPRGSHLPFKVAGQPEPGRAWLACVSAPAGADFALRAMDGRIRFGPYASDGTCRFELLDEGQVAWYRLQPGTHALCAQQVPNRRPWLPNEFRGRWLLRRSRAALHVRSLALPRAAPQS